VRESLAEASLQCCYCSLEKECPRGVGIRYPRVCAHWSASKQWKIQHSCSLSLILLMIKQILSLKAVETSTAGHTEGSTQTLDYYFPPTKTMIQPSVAS